MPYAGNPYRTRLARERAHSARMAQSGFQTTGPQESQLQRMARHAAAAKAYAEAPAKGSGIRTMAPSVTQNLPAVVSPFQDSVAERQAQGANRAAAARARLYPVTLDKSQYRAVQTLQRFSPVGRALLRGLPWLRALDFALTLAQLGGVLPKPDVGGTAQVMNFTGYTLEYTCAGSTTLWTGNQTHANCGQTAFVILPPWFSPAHLAGTSRPFFLAGWTNVVPRPGVPGQYLAAARERWIRNAVSGPKVIQQVTYPRATANPARTFVEGHRGSFDPDALPIAAFVPLPLPLPWPLVPYKRPSPIAAFSYDAGYAPPGTPRPVNPGPLPRPPKKGTKERKLKASRGVAALVRAVNSATEADDLVNAIYKAIPKSIRPRCEPGKRGVLCRSKAVWKHFGSIDWDTAIFNIIWENQFDKVWAKLGVPTKDLNRLQGSNQGINTILGLSHGDSISGVERAARQHVVGVLQRHGISVF